jgi:hypothetical protein
VQPTSCCYWPRWSPLSHLPVLLSVAASPRPALPPTARRRTLRRGTLRKTSPPTATPNWYWEAVNACPVATTVSPAPLRLLALPACRVSTWWEDSAPYAATAVFPVWSRMAFLSAPVAPLGRTLYPVLPHAAIVARGQVLAQAPPSSLPAKLPTCSPQTPSSASPVPPTAHLAPPPAPPAPPAPLDSTSTAVFATPARSISVRLVPL